MEFWGMITFMVAGGAMAIAGAAFAKIRALEEEIKQIKAKLDSRA